jgi:hypothetical protein
LRSTRMRWFNDRSTLAKLLGTFAALCAAMGVVGYLGLSSAQNVQDRLEDASTNLLPSALAVASMDSALNDVRVTARSALIESDPAAVALLVAHATNSLAEAEKQEAIFKAFPDPDPLDVRLLADYDQVYPQWKASIQTVLKDATLSTPEADAAAADSLLHTSTAMAAQIDKDVTDLADSQDRQATDSALESAVAFDQRGGGGKLGGDRGDGGASQRGQWLDPVDRVGFRTAERSHRTSLGEHGGDERPGRADGRASSATGSHSRSTQTACVALQARRLRRVSRGQRSHTSGTSNESAAARRLKSPVATSCLLCSIRMLRSLATYRRYRSSGRRAEHPLDSRCSTCRRRSFAKTLSLNLP